MIVIPLDEIVQLSPIYNLPGRMDPNDFDYFNFKKVYKTHRKQMKDFNTLIKNVVIVHYAGKRKPWNDINLLFADYWWNYAKIINPAWEPELRKRKGK